MKTRVLLCAVAAIAFQQHVAAANYVAGPGSTSAGDNNVVVGVNASASAGYGLPFGNVVIGSGASSNTSSAVAIGSGAFVSGDGAIAIGQYATSTSQSSIALGWTTVGGQANNVGIGGVVNGSDTTWATAINGGVASHSHSIALGLGAQTSRSYELALGGRYIGGLLAGVNADDAVNVSQLLNVQNTAQSAATAASLASSAVAALQGDVTTMQGQVTSAYDAALAAGVVAANAQSQAAAAHATATAAGSAVTLLQNDVTAMQGQVTSAYDAALAAGVVAAGAQSQAAAAYNMAQAADAKASHALDVAAGAYAYADIKYGQAIKYAARGIAAALAASAAAAPMPGETVVTVGTGHYDGASAVGVSFAHAPRRGPQISGGAAIASGGKPALKAGLTWRF